MSTCSARQLHAVLLVAICALLPASCKSNQRATWNSAFEDCRTLLLKQQDAWNKGDLDAFVAGYHDSDDTVFCTKKGTKFGRKAVLATYKLSYPDRKGMGSLKFSDMHFSFLSKDEVLVRGRWLLQKEGSSPRGSYILVIRHFPIGWKVVLDYSTSD